MEIHNEIVILRDFIESDIEDMIYWETTETEWQLWDAPWEYYNKVIFNSEEYRKNRLEWLSKQKDENRVRHRFEICINNEYKRHIGWCSAYYIDSDYKYTKEKKNCTIGINIPDIYSRNKGYATEAWKLFIQYLLDSGLEDIYTQTWSGNKRVIGLIHKLGFEECHRESRCRYVRGQLYDGLTFKLNKEKYSRL